MTPDLAQTLVTQCPVALSLHDPLGSFRAASDECVRVFGRDRAALLRGSIFDLVDARDLERVRDGWGREALRGEGCSLRYRLAADPEVWIATDLRRAEPSSAGLSSPEPSSGELSRTGPSSSEPWRAGSAAQIACASRRLGADAGLAAIDASALENAELARRHRDILVEMLPGLVWYGQVAPDLRTYRLSYLSDYLFTITGYTRVQWIETPGFWRSIIHPEDLERTLASTAAMMRGESERGPQYRLRASDGRYLWVQSSMHIERDAAGEPQRMYGLTLDITSHVETERENAAFQRELAERAQRIIELSAPLLPLGGGVLLLPLVGAMDPARSEHAFGALLQAVQQTRARRVIIDLTGVGAVDHDSVAALVRASEAVRLLGARTMLTGLQPVVALALLELDIPFTLRSFPSIEAALRAK